MTRTAPHQHRAHRAALSRAARELAAELQRDCDGSLTLEYAVLIGCVALGGALGLCGIGMALLDSFVAIRSGVLAPFP
jgi:hypothetical protein